MSFLSRKSNSITTSLFIGFVAMALSFSVATVSHAQATDDTVETISTVETLGPGVIIGGNPITTDGSIVGWGWSDTIGWISFNCITDGTNCRPYSYGVTVSPGKRLGVSAVPNAVNDTGALSGYAWSPNIGWISFNAADVSVCGGSPVMYFDTGRVSGFARALSGNQASNISGGWSGCISFDYTMDGNNRGVVTYDETTFDGTGYNILQPGARRVARLFTTWAWGSSNDATDGVIGWIDMSLSRYIVRADIKAKPSLVLDASTFSVPAPYYVDLNWYAVDENGTPNLSSNLGFTQCQSHTYDGSALITTSSPFDGGISDPPSGETQVFVSLPATTYVIDCKLLNPTTGVSETIQSNAVTVRRFKNDDIPSVDITGPSCIVPPRAINLSWTISNATSCTTTFTRPATIPTINDVLSITPTALGTFTYTITCTNDNGVSSDTATVEVAKECSTKPPDEPPKKTKRKFLFFEF